MSGKKAPGHGGHGGRRAKKHEEHEEHENHERWLVSAFDMMTLLFVLFVVLFAMSKVDEDKFAALAKGLAESFGNPVTVLTSTTPDSGSWRHRWSRVRPSGIGPRNSS